ncbi:MAG: M42 family peptidase [Ruminococcaceae bacterium]|nr:M42 family peptidase [Oscillospiraceae bacterium]
MEKLYELVENFTSYPGVSGYESMAFEELENYVKSLGIFDEFGTTPAGSFYGIIRCGKKDAEMILCDAHLDTIGCLVTEICDGGFLKVANVGGIAGKILSGSDVNIYGKKAIKGIFASKPPHLQEPGESEKKIEVVDMCIDTGLSKEELEKIVRIGTPVAFPCRLEKLVDNNLAGAGFDDRLCGAAIVRGLMMLDKSKLNVDVAFQFSGGEEIGYKGARTNTYKLNPDKAIVIDVTHAFVPGAPKAREAVYAGKGGDICLSPQTNRAFTKYCIEVCKKENIPYQISASPGATGTNSNAVQTTRNGVPVMLISIPLKNMHTMSEIVNMDDAYNTARVVSAVIQSL